MPTSRLAKITFWAATAGIVHTHVTYPLTLLGLRRLRGDRAAVPVPDLGAEPPSVSLIVAAFDEEAVIGAKVAGVLALDYPREMLELIVASDGSTDGTVEAARTAGADLVLDFSRGGKMAAQNAAVDRASGEILAFSDANSEWAPDALAALAAAFDDPAVGYASGEVAFTADDEAEATNEEGAYWRLENMVRELESDLGGITAGNGAIYAVRRGAYRFLGPSRSHDLSFPFELAKDGWRSVYVPAARASEKMVPTLEGEFARKRRMMIGLPDIVVADRMWDPRGYGVLFGYEILSHRLLRYATPLLHVKLLVANVALLAAARRRYHGDSSGMHPAARTTYRLALAAQLTLLALAALPKRLPLRAARLARYYVFVTASIALGFWDRWRQGPPAAWEKSEGTR